MFIKPDMVKYISGLSLIVSILTFIMNMYYNSKAEEHKKLTNTPLFLFDMTEYGYKLDKNFTKDSIQMDIFNFEEDYSIVVNNKAKSMYIGKNKNYLLLRNVGGVAKNVVVKSEVIWNKEEFKNHKERIIYEDYERELTFDGEFCHLISNNNKYGISNKRIKFNAHTTQSKIKGVSKENNLLVSIPREFSYTINFYLYGYIKMPPRLLVTVLGEDLAGYQLKDEIEIKVQRYKFSCNPVEAEITMFA